MHKIFGISTGGNDGTIYVIVGLEEQIDLILLLMTHVFSIDECCYRLM